MKVQIFDVEHGACALVTTDTGAHLLIDCGHNSTTGWRPSIYLPAQGVTSLAGLIITNYDEDHASDLPNVLSRLPVEVLYRNRSVTPGDLFRLKSETGMGRGIERLATMAGTYTANLTNPPDLGGLTIRCFYNLYPRDFDDENNLSMAVFLECHGLCILFPGDLERAGWLKLLERPEFVEQLRKVNVLVASHHGRESGCCEEMFKLWLPQIVIMSDCGIKYDTQATVAWYAARSISMDYNGEPRSVFTTRKDGRITIEATPNGISISTHRAERQASQMRA